MPTTLGRVGFVLGVCTAVLSTGAGCAELLGIRDAVDGGAAGMGGQGGAGATGGSGGASSTGATGGTAPCEPLQCDAIVGIPSECIAIADNSGQTHFGLRIAQLTFQKPDVFRNPVVAGLLEVGVTMNLAECNQTGDGTFSWLLELDTGLGTLKTGGAKPVADPTAGYCFVNEMLGTTPVTPLVLNAAPDADDMINVAMGGDVVIPIFLGSVADYFLVPLRDFRILGAALSADRNCIGVYNEDKLPLEDSCEPSGDVTRFTEAGAIDAYITLEDADAVVFDSLVQSLCVLLTGDAGDGGSPKKCSRDPGTGQILAKGDWCSATDSAGGCQDSLQLTGTFAASAVEITGDCR